MCQLIEEALGGRRVAMAYAIRMLGFDETDGCLEDHFGEAVVEFNVERWGSEALYTS